MRAHEVTRAASHQRLPLFVAVAYSHGATGRHSVLLCRCINVRCMIRGKAIDLETLAIGKLTWYCSSQEEQARLCHTKVTCESKAGADQKKQKGLKQESTD